MSKRVDAVYLTDMLTHARRVLERLGTIHRDEFERDIGLQESVVFNIVVIGEAATKVSEATRDVHPEIAWTDISDMRNRLIHGYFSIDFGKVWQAATVDVPRSSPPSSGFSPDSALPTHQPWRESHRIDETFRD